MNKKILSLVLVLAMLLTSLVMVVPTSATTTKPLVTRGWIVAIDGHGTDQNGMCVIYLLSDGTFMIYDGGGGYKDKNKTQPKTIDAQNLYNQLRAIADEYSIQDIVVSVWVFTHPHGDHMDFLHHWAPYKDLVEVREIWYHAWNTGYNKVISELFPNTPIRDVKAGEEYQIADVHVKILSTIHNLDKSLYSGTEVTYTNYTGSKSSGTADGNNSSIVMRLDIGTTSVLMTGDAGYEVFEYIYNNYRSDMDVDIYQVPHHGVGSPGGKYGTANTKHHTAISPSTIIIPSGHGLISQVKGGQRADTNQPSEGMYKLYLDFGVSPTEYTGTGSKGKYYVAGYLNGNLNNARRQMFVESEIDFKLPTDITMLDGAGIRCVPNGTSGLRFMTDIPKATIDALDALVAAGDVTSYTFGTVIFEASSLKYIVGEPTVATLENANRRYVDIPATKGVRENEDGSKTLLAALVNLKERNYFKDFAAIAYIECELACGVTLRVYSTLDETENVRNINYVAREALAHVSTTRGWTKDQYGSWYFGYQITDAADPNYGKYSPYTATQREILKVYVSSNADTNAGYDGDDTADSIWN